MPPPGIADLRSWALLLGVLAVGLFLRAENVGWGLPDYSVPDERVFTAENWERMESQPPARSHFVYPHLEIRSVALLDAVASRLGADDDLAAQIGRARIFGVILSILTVWVVFATGRELFGAGAGLAAAAFLAVAPFAVVAAHTNLSDVALTFWVAVSFLLAARGSRSGQPGWLLASGLIAGLAGAAKYPGLAAVGPPLWASLFAGPERGRLLRRRPLVATGIFAGVLACCAAGFYAGCPRCVSEWDLCVEAIRSHGEVIYELGSGSPLPAEGLLGYRYLYQILAVNPYVLGALACALAYLGLAFMTRRNARSAALVASFAIPYFLVMGGSGAAFARYCLPLAPFLCLAAGLLSSRLLEASGWRRGVAAGVVGAALVHALLFSYRQVDGFVDENRERVIAWLEARTQQQTFGRPAAAKPGVGIILFGGNYDAIRQPLRATPTLRLVGLQPDREQLEKSSPDYLVFSMPFLVRVRRQEAAEGGSFWSDLDQGVLGYRRAAEFPPRFRAEGIYSVLDPIHAHAWTNGDIGFVIYEKAPGRGSVAPRAAQR